VTPKLRALLEYQLSLRPPRVRRGSLDEAAVRRGRRLFRNEARCVTCHQGPTFTDVLGGPSRKAPFLHEPSETGMDPGYAARSATGKYRTTPLRGLLQHPPYFHDGSAPDLPAVVEHYVAEFGLDLTPAQKADLVEYLSSL
jgi:cytochrome c peroxidase